MNKRATQFLRVFRVMQDGRWHTLRAISQRLGGAPEASVSARLRDLRKLGIRVGRRPSAKRGRAITYAYAIRGASVQW